MAEGAGCARGTFRIPADSERRAEQLLRKRFADLQYWNLDDAVKQSMALDGVRSRFSYLRTILPVAAFRQEARVLVSGMEAGGEMIAAREQGFGAIHGVDVDPFFVEVARTRLAGLEGFDCRLYDGLRLPYAEDEFDLVLSGHVIEHTADPRVYLGELLRVLRSGGHIFLEFPNRFHAKELHTGLPSVEWAPLPVRSFALQFLSSRLSPFGPEARRRYRVILETGLKPVSLRLVRSWLARSGSETVFVDVSRPSPGVIRGIIRKTGARKSAA